MSYIKIISGELRKDAEGKDISGSNEFGFKFNQEALELFWTNLNYEQGTASGEVYAACYGGLCANERVKQTGKVWTFEQACDLVDTFTDEDKKSIMLCMQETTKYKETLEKVQGLVRDAQAEAEKKSLTAAV